MARRRGTRFGSALAASLALHAAAAAGVVAAVTWRTLPAPPGAEPALEILWLAPQAATEAPAGPPQAPHTDPAIREIATLGPAAQEGAEPEDALATMVALPDAPPSATEPVAVLAPLPVEMPEPPPPPEDPTSLFATPERSPLLAALPVPPPAPASATAEPAEALPPPPPQPAAPPPRRAAAPPRAAPAPATQLAAHAVPAPRAAPAVAPAAIPVLSAAPRFRRPPAPPDYPLRAKEAGITGTALLRIRVAADGSTQEIRLLRSAGHRLLDEAAQAAARRWEIAPAMQDGRAIEAWVDVPVRFALEE